MWHHQLVKSVQRLWWSTERSFVYCKTRRHNGGDGVCLVTVEKAWENIPAQVPIWSTEKKHIEDRKYESIRRKGVELKLYQLLLVHSQAAVPGGCLTTLCLLYRSKGAVSLQFRLSKHIQSGPVFDPLLTFSPDVSSFWAGCVVHCERGKRLVALGPPKRWRALYVSSISRNSPETKCHNIECHILFCFERQVSISAPYSYR